MEFITAIFQKVPGVVLLIFFLIGIFSFAIFLERFSNVKKSKVLPKNWNQIKIYLLNGNFEAVLNLLRKEKRNFLARTLANILELYAKGEIDKAALRQMVEGETSLIYYELSKKISFLSVSVTISTFTGLLGTVMGLIEVFGAFSFSTPEGLKELSRGIATCLYSTLTGLLLAIIIYFLYWLIKSRVDGVYAKVVKELEEMLELIR